MPAESIPTQRLPASIWELGFVSLLQVFMVTVLGTSMLTMDLIEGPA